MNKTTRPLVPVTPTPVPVAPAVIDDGFIKSRIHTIRGEQVMLSPDLADLYQVETRAFNQAVKRNEERFPPSFRFQLTKEELRKVITNCDNPDRLRFSPQTPYAFTEQGVAMLSGILNSAVAVRVSIRIMETFVAMRKALAEVGDGAAEDAGALEAPRRVPVVDEGPDVPRREEDGAVLDEDAQCLGPVVPGDLDHFRSSLLSFSSPARTAAASALTFSSFAERRSQWSTKSRQHSSWLSPRPMGELRTS